MINLSRIVRAALTLASTLVVSADWLRPDFGILDFLPIAHPVNAMIMGSEGYSCEDFVRIGGPLTILLFLVILTALHFSRHI